MDILEFIRNNSETDLLETLSYYFFAPPPMRERLRNEFRRRFDVSEYDDEQIEFLMAEHAILEAVALDLQNKIQALKTEYKTNPWFMHFDVTDEFFDSIFMEWRKNFTFDWPKITDLLEELGES